MTQYELTVYYLTQLPPDHDDLLLIMYSACGGRLDSARTPVYMYMQRMMIRESHRTRSLGPRRRVRPHTLENSGMLLTVSAAACG